KQIFSAGHEVTIRMSMKEGEALVCVGFTNTTPTTGWNYLFYNDSLYFEEGQDTMLLTRKIGVPTVRTTKILSGFDQTEFHTYRLVWNSTVVIAYVDGIRLGAIGGGMPSGPLHFKIAITENRNQITDGWICIDSIIIKEHNSMIDENPPFITLNSPGNGTLNLGRDPIEIVPVGSDGQLYWSWDGSANDTGTEPYDISLPDTEGLHTLDVYCKDGYGYDNWAHVRYVFNTMVTPPMLNTAWCSSAPTIDGVIQTGEWPALSLNTIELVREDGSKELVDIYLGSDSSFVYVGFDSSIPSGHDSRASLIISGTNNGSYYGSNETPIITAYYTKGSPQAWDGYDELKCLWDEEGVVKEMKLEPKPSGFLSFSSEQDLNVHYEFRFPLEELNVVPGSTVGISLMLFPTGMGVHNLFYPIAHPWDNASKLANLKLALPPNTLLIQTFVAVGAIGLVAIASYLGWTRRPRSIQVLDADSDSIQRIKGIVESYDKIEIERLSQMTNLSPAEVKKIVTHLIEQREIDVKIVEEEVVRGK
ncbi:MAG: PCI domain-containing protein, partial [Candidatus Thorarchaeota archaeon]|nr:PCI domain-containing protein [Candidatus Thorarchaeota archaeon]